MYMYMFLCSLVRAKLSQSAMLRVGLLVALAILPALPTVLGKPSVRRKWSLGRSLGDENEVYDKGQNYCEVDGVTYQVGRYMLINKGHIPGRPIYMLINKGHIPGRPIHAYKQRAHTR